MNPTAADEAGSAYLFPARLTELSRMVDLVRTRCAALGATPALVARVELAVEELFANTVQHGYRKRPGGSVWVTIVPSAAGIRITYEDAAPRYNPLTIDTATLDQVHAVDNPEMRPIGGLGRLLVARLCAASSYGYDNSRQRNVLNLDFSP